MTRPKVDETLALDFEALLDAPKLDGRQREQAVQDFLEKHTELIPTPNLLNHHLHFQAIISKFPLSTELTTDYAYVTKSSDEWRITFVELESPDKRIFTADTSKATTTAEFNGAVAQIRSWKHLIEEHRDEVTRKLATFMQPSPMRRNPVSFEFQLVIGRSQEKNLTQDRTRTVRSLREETGFDIMTYDGLLNHYRNGQPYIKNVLRLSGTRFAFKYMHREPEHLFSFLGPGDIALAPDEIERLKTAGFDMDAWKQGDLLVVNGRGAKLSGLLTRRTPPSS